MAPEDHKSEFDAFIQRQLASQSKVDWTQELEFWLQQLRGLYETIERLLARYIASNAVKLHFDEVQIVEENVGAYLTKKLTISIGPQHIEFRPVGTMLIGVKGRVDVIGPAGRSRLVLVRKGASRPLARVTTVSEPKPGYPAPGEAEGDWAWKIATSPPRVEYIELTEETLFRLLLEVANG